VGMHRTTSNQNYKDTFTFSDLGINVPQPENAFPNIYIADTGFETGTSSALAFFEEEYNISDALSWSKGKHQLTFGGAFAYGRDHMQKFDYEAYVIPLTWADLLLGQSYLPYGVPYSNIYESADSVGDKVRDWRYKDADAYVQDNYSITKRLTLNLGLRYEHIGDLGDARGLTGNVIVADIDPNPPASGSYAGYEVGSNYHAAAALPQGAVRGPNTFGITGQGQDTINPRIGFEYLLPGGDKMVLRGGAGLYHSTPEGQLNVQLSSEQPFGGFRTLVGSANAAATDAMPFAPAPAFWAGRSTKRIWRRQKTRFAARPRILWRTFRCALRTWVGRRRRCTTSERRGRPGTTLCRHRCRSITKISCSTRLPIHGRGC